MSTCPPIVRGPGTPMRVRAANDDAPAGSVVAESRVQAASAGVVVTLFSDRKTAHTARHPARWRDAHQDNDTPPYDHLLGIVRAEMAQPSP
jgi:hypothetical protein